MESQRNKRRHYDDTGAPLRSRPCPRNLNDMSHGPSMPLPQVANGPVVNSIPLLNAGRPPIAFERTVERTPQQRHPPFIPTPRSLVVAPVGDLFTR